MPQLDYHIKLGFKLDFKDQNLGQDVIKTMCARI